MSEHRKAVNIWVLSDLHLEFAPIHLPEVDADVVVLAGDIDLGTAGVEWATQTFRGRPVIYVTGNHEFYRGHWDEVIPALRAAANGTNVYVLEMNSVELLGVRFIGATLWTDFRLFGDASRMAALEDAGTRLNDFRLVNASPWFDEPAGTNTPKRVQRLSPSHTVDRFNASRKYLEEELARPFDGPTVVVTHHLPHRESVAERFKDDLLSAAFASDLASTIELYQPAAWIHGHTRDSFDYNVGATRIVCNPRGYTRSTGSKEDDMFDASLSVLVCGRGGAIF